jgi:hypothetical protein
MTIVERRNLLLKKIETIEDDNLLEALNAIIESDKAEIVQFTKKEEEQVLRGHNQYKAGNFKTAEKIEQKINLWLEQ